MADYAPPVVPADVQATIDQLVAKRQAVILSHYYCRPEIHEVAHFVGDSLGLSQEAARNPAKVIIFCGVHFMAETASILCPEKTVILANIEAGCPMADMITYEALAARKKELNGVPVLTYVNSPAAVKALSDICCTSANVVAVLRSLPSKTILMTPDKNLAIHAQKFTPEKEILTWPGFCPTHHRLNLAEIMALKEAHPEAEVLAHPECQPKILREAHFIGSTSGIIKRVADSPKKEFIVLTEEGVLHPIRKNNPGKIFYTPKTAMICPNMKKNSLDDIISALENMDPIIKVPEEIRLPALRAVDRMMAVPRD
ncbi:MAG: quinolinate synthase NadA [Deltaproteobacteria bacterium]|jgi:quinolinate synthase|nr:quinolinate synthase NadA [Deltaproteobacteria bacterium]